MKGQGSPPTFSKTAYRSWLSGLFLIVLLSQPCLAFDTGRHTDLTRNALLREGFNDDAINIVTVDNWLTDLYSATPSSLLSSEFVREIYPKTGGQIVIKSYTSELHFDNLFDNRQIEIYWRRLISNTQKAIAAKAGPKPDIPALLAILGMSLHAVQDFYSHSNWVQRYGSTDNFASKTWLDVASSTEPMQELHTGWYDFKEPIKNGQERHDDFNKVVGLNKDSYSRPDWERAYVFAYSATRQWIREFRKWLWIARVPYNDIGEPVWDQMMKYSCGVNFIALMQDLSFAYHMSEWVDSPLASTSGKWKGNGSRNLLMGPSAFNAWAHRIPDSEQELQFTQKEIYGLLVEGLYDFVTPVPNLPAIGNTNASGEKALIVRTIEIKGFPIKIQTPDPPFPINTQTPDLPEFLNNMYAKLNFSDGNRYSQDLIESTQQGKPIVTGDDMKWESIVFVPGDTQKININYDLFDERGWNSEIVNITSSPNSSTGLRFSYVFGSGTCSGDVNGRFNSRDNAFSTGNPTSANRGLIRFFVTEKSLR